MNKMKLENKKITYTKICYFIKHLRTFLLILCNIIFSSKLVQKINLNLHLIIKFNISSFIL